MLGPVCACTRTKRRILGYQTNYSLVQPHPIPRANCVFKILLQKIHSRYTEKNALHLKYMQYMQFLANMHPEPGKILTMSTSWCWDTIDETPCRLPVRLSQHHSLRQSDTVMKPHAGCLHGVNFITVSDCHNTIPWILCPDSVAWYAPIYTILQLSVHWSNESLNDLWMTVKKCSGETRKSDLYSCNGSLPSNEMMT